jgi:hypothetical protein
MSLESSEAASEHLMTVTFKNGQELMKKGAHGTKQAWEEDSGATISDPEPEKEYLNDELNGSMQRICFEKSQVLPRKDCAQVLLRPERKFFISKNCIANTLRSPSISITIVPQQFMA